MKTRRLQNWAHPIFKLAQVPLYWKSMSWSIIGWMVWVGSSPVVTIQAWCFNRVVVLGFVVSYRLRISIAKNSWEQKNIFFFFHNLQRLDSSFMKKLRIQFWISYDMVDSESVERCHSRTSSQKAIFAGSWRQFPGCQGRRQRLLLLFHLQLQCEKTFLSYHHHFLS